ncbi:hypothetical protein [Pseudomonas sp.]|uniref:hypothetical protein n=1 Tax=Pseudomonas sp. TaxID=306 RepID=UPI00290C0462|nr:glycogen branching protein [Pseudomonas sp.]MDU4250481.1 glycogen branching protein [Pseudomonas sp.]
MPEIKITKAFNFREGAAVKHYSKSEKPVEVSQDVAEHAWAHDFAAKPKAEKPAPAASTEPSAAN